MKPGHRGGFTLVEVLVVLVIASLVAVALHRAQLQYRRVALWSSAVIQDHDAFRVTTSLLAADLRESVYAQGDVVLHADDSLSVRAPLGFALVCSVRQNPASVGVSLGEGLPWEDPGDSLLVYTPARWISLVPTGILRNPPRTLDCGTLGRRPDLAYSLSRGEADSIPVGAPIRVYRRHTYHVGINEGQPWLARTDASGTEMLVGPLAREGLRFRLLDNAGSPTGPTTATALEARLVLPLTPVQVGASSQADTFTFVIHGRNR